MKSIGRNDPCSCGSGKKYKKCCQSAVEQTDVEYRLQYNLEAALIPRLLAFGHEVLGPDAIEDAWIEFMGDEDVEGVEPDDPLNVTFIPWFFFNYIFEFQHDGEEVSFETTIGELFLESSDDRTPDEESLLRSLIRTPYTLCEVLDVQPGKRVKLLDLLREREFEITDHATSLALQSGEIVYSAITRWRQTNSMLGMSPYLLQPIQIAEVLDLRRELITESGNSTLDDDDLFEFESDIRQTYFHLSAVIFAPDEFFETDEDPFVMQSVHFDLDSVDEAYHQLKYLAGSDNEHKLLSLTTRKNDRIVEATIPWIETPEGSQQEDGPTLLGVLGLKDCSLVAEVRSTESAEIIQRIVTERLSDRARYKMTHFSPAAGVAQRLFEQRMSKPEAAERIRRAQAAEDSKTDL